MLWVILLEKKNYLCQKRDGIRWFDGIDKCEIKFCFFSRISWRKVKNKNCVMGKPWECFLVSFFALLIFIRQLPILVSNVLLVIPKSWGLHIPKTVKKVDNESAFLWVGSTKIFKIFKKLWKGYNAFSGSKKWVNTKIVCFFKYIKLKVFVLACESFLKFCQNIGRQFM